MPRRLALLLALLLAGCTDLVGVGGDCSSEMSELRQDRGLPSSTQRSPSIGGDFSEVWIYSSGGSIERYTFRWGASYPACEVSGPEPVNSRSPLPPPLSPDGGR